MKKLFVVLILILFTAGCSVVGRSADIDTPINYAKYDLNDINAVRKATKEYQGKFKDRKGTKEAEEEFLRFLEFYYDFSFKQFYLVKISIPEKYYKEWSFVQSRKLTKKYLNKGLKVEYLGLDRFYLTYSYEYLYKKFHIYLGNDWKEFLKYEGELEKRYILDDCEYVISKDKLEAIKKFYEDFYKKYPNFVKRETIKNRIEGYEEDLKHYPYVKCIN